MSNLTKRPVTPKNEKRKKSVSKTEADHPASKYGTNDEFLSWVSYQPSCLDRKWNQVLNGIGRNIACHVRRQSDGAGMGIKPPFRAVPMTNDQHQIQSRYGEDGAIRQFMNIRVTPEQAKQMFDGMAEATLSRWIRAVTKGKHRGIN